jgi:hypothetical protein
VIDRSAPRPYPEPEAKEKEFEEKEALMQKQSFLDPGEAGGGQDPGFSFPLPMSVQGVNAHGREFSEETVLSFISHEISSFILRNPILVGIRLRLIIDLPEKLSLEDKDLKLVIKGHVEKVEPLRDRAASQKITLKFDGKYIIKPEA